MAGRRPNTQIRDKVLALRAAGMTMDDIHEKLGISVQLVAYYSKPLPSKAGSIKK